MRVNLRQKGSILLKENLASDYGNMKIVGCIRECKNKEKTRERQRESEKPSKDEKGFFVFVRERAAEE